MRETTQKITINRPAQEVFEFVLNPENTPKWVDGVVKERTNESPQKLGTIYKNQDHAGNWSEFEITGYEPGVMFELTKRDDNHHVKYTLRPIDDSKCELEYGVWVDTGEVSQRFGPDSIESILQKLKAVMEQAA